MQPLSAKHLALTALTSPTELLRSYRIAHSRATSIEPFEKALKENTPLTSIKDPEALIEYLNQINLKSDMLMEELRRVTTEKDTYKKKADETEKELTALKEEVATLKAAKSQKKRRRFPGRKG